MQIKLLKLLIYLTGMDKESKVHGALHENLNTLKYLMVKIVTSVLRSLHYSFLEYSFHIRISTRIFGNPNGTLPVWKTMFAYGESGH